MTAEPMMTSFNADAVAGLADVLRAGNRFRRLVVVCGRGHRLAAVYGTAHGPVLLGTAPAVMTYTSDYRPNGLYIGGSNLDSDGHTGSRRRAREIQVGVRLDGEPDAARLDVSCRCRTARLHAGWLRSLLAAGTRRAVTEAGHTPTR